MQLAILEIVDDFVKKDSEEVRVGVINISFTIIPHRDLMKAIKHVSL